MREPVVKSAVQCRRMAADKCMLLVLLVVGLLTLTHVLSAQTPQITSLAPSSGPVGTSVTVTGSNFGATQGSNTLKFGGVAATITSWSATSIVGLIPSGLAVGTINAKVWVGGVGSNEVPFTVTPSITSLSPNSGPVGTSVIVTGTNFGSTQGTSTVKFNGTTATPTSWSATSIVVPVPSGATTGNVVVTVNSIGSNNVSFTVTPKITSLSPTSGSIGTSVTITGTTFGTTQGSSTVKFNGTTATPTSWSATSIVVPVPSGATTGNVVVTVSGQASNGVSFTVSGGSAPTITSLSPTSGPAGTSVTITGTNFGSTQGTSTVAFNGVTAIPTSWSASSIAVPVPSAATTGNVVVTVSGQTSNGVSFTVTPKITSLSPTSGPVGISVTISGTTFGATQGSSTVKFNGTTTTPTSWNTTSIAAPVPAGATTGNVVVTVSGQTSNGVSFTVTGPVPSIASISPNPAPVGRAVYITGSNFGSSGTVTFGGVSATATSWSSTLISAVVPSGAPTGNVVVTVGGQASGGYSFTVGTAVENLVTSTTYDMVGYKTSVAFGSGDSDVYTYDSKTGRMTQYQFNVGGQAVVGTMGWNPNGSLGTLGISDPLNSANNQNCTYTHDDLARIGSVNCVNGSTNVWNQTFAYDAFGNISKTSTGPGVTFPGSLPAQAYSSSSNWLNPMSGCTPTYDAVGEMTSDCVHNYGWDAEGKMISVDTNTTIVYDALGRMVEKSVSGTVTEIVYGPTGAKMAIMSGQVLQKGLIQLPAGATAVYTSTGLVYRHTDHLGSSRLATTSVRTLYSSVAYAPYGESYAQAGTPDLSFTGQDQDTVSGLHDFLNRRYSPGQGRWLSPDPAGLAAANAANPQSWNRYAYVLNNPMALVDPSGLDPCNLNGAHVDGDVTCLTPPACGGGTICVTAWGFNDWIDPTFEASTRDPNCPSGFLCVSLGVDLPSIVGVVPGGGGGGFPSGIINNNPVMPKLCTATDAAVARANAMWSTIEKAADANSIDPALLAAIGIRETGFNNVWQGCNDTTIMCSGADGAGIYQIDLGPYGGNPNVSVAQAFDPVFAANFAANKLGASIDKYEPFLGYAWATYAAIHDYNSSPRHTLPAIASGLAGNGVVSGLDQTTTGHDYVSDILSMLGCF